MTFWLRLRRRRERTSDDAQHVYDQLGRLGYVADDRWREPGRLGSNAEAALRDFQRKRGLDPTGQPDVLTLRQLDAAVDAANPKPRIVRGRVRHQDGQPLSALTVLAFDRDLRRDEPLGEDVTGDDGTYEIQYTPDQLALAERGSADLVVRVYTPEGVTLAASVVQYNALDEAVVDLVVTPEKAPEEPTLSEYERLIVDLDPLIAPLTLDQLTEDDIEFLAREMGIDASLLRALARSAVLSHETALPTAAFYGWARRGLALDLDALLGVEPGDLIKHITQAIEAELIPEGLTAGLGGIRQRLDLMRMTRQARDRVARRFAGRLVGAAEGDPVSGYAVAAFDLNADPAPVALGTATTGLDGRFAFVFTVTHNQANATRRLRVQVRDREGQLVLQRDLDAEPGQKEPIDVVVPEPAGPALPTTDLEVLQSDLQLDLPPGLLPALDAAGIRTLSDVRAAGGLGRVDGLPVEPDHAAVRLLEAHANLELLMPEPRRAATLIGHGYTSIAAIAGTSTVDFVGTTANDLGDVAATQTHIQASAQSRSLNGTSVNIRADLANGLEPVIHEPRILELFPQRCACADCEAAVSPAAYLTDLTSYVLSHVRRNSQAIDLNFLTTTFRQPFGDLPASCAATEEQLHQIRLFVEVVRRHLAARALTPAVRTALARSEAAYREAAYAALLTAIGASYAELRLAARADDATRQALADRLGIARNRLAELTLAPAATTESALERLFGLVATVNDDGTLPNPLRVVAVPSLVTWRRAHLRTVWAAQDWPGDPYSRAELPVIEPDLIGPDDIRRAAAGEPAFDLWRRRREWIDARLRNLADPQQRPLHDVRGRPATDLDALFATMYQPIVYQTFDNQAPPSVPWANTQPGDFAALASRLAHGTADEVTGAIDTLAGDLNLTVDSFARIMEIWEQHRRWERGGEYPPVGDAEWRELDSILVQSRKVALFAAWRAEEGRAQLRFGPDTFWISAREPIVGDWPPRRVPILEAPQRSAPLIDPEIVSARELPDPLGSRSRAVWEQRQQQLGDLRRQFRATSEGQGFQALVEEALGDPQNNNALPFDLDDLLFRLNDLDPAVVGPAESDVATLHLTVEAFRRLMEVRAKDADARARNSPDWPPPAASEWDEVYALLTSAHKELRWYLTWADEEEDQQTGLAYWEALKARLPRWRASGTARQAWQEALHQRSGAPLIDPDLIGTGDLVNPTLGNGAFNRWNARRVWIENQATTLRDGRAQAADRRIWLDDQLGAVLGRPAVYLEELAAERDAGVDIRPWLDQLGLTNPAYLVLLRIWRLAVQDPATVLAEEWDDLDAILVQVAKQRQHEVWREDERQAGLTLRPDLFRIAEPDILVLPEWRAAWDARRTWRETLQSRIDQERTSLEALQDAVFAVEEAVLPRLRDALIAASPDGGSGFADKATWLTDHLLMDAGAGSCQVTTRVAQAIETLQLLVWSIRTGQLTDTYPELSLSAPFFEAEWRWIGSYATWRAAVFVFLYPENILRPRFRNARQSTEGFDAVVTQLDASPSADLTSTREAAQLYASYYRDVTTIQVKAVCQAVADLPVGPRLLTYLFGVSSRSSLCYWSVYDSQDASGYGQSYWARVEGLENVSRLLGAVPFRGLDGQPFILLFAQVQADDTQQLKVARYDLHQLGWQSAPADLPIDWPFTAVLGQQLTEEPPLLVVRNETTGLLHYQRLNVSGDGWENGDWTLDAAEIEAGLRAAPNLVLKALVPHQDGAGGRAVLIAQSSFPGASPDPGRWPATTAERPFWFRIVGDNSHPHWEPLTEGDVGTGAWLGAFRLPGQATVYAWWLTGNGSEVRVRQIVPPGGVAPETLHGMSPFDDWLYRLTGRKIRDISIDEVADAQFRLEERDDVTIQWWLDDTEFHPQTVFHLLTERPREYLRASTQDSDGREKLGRLGRARQAAVDRIRDRIAEARALAIEQVASPGQISADYQHEIRWRIWALADDVVQANSPGGRSIDGHLTLLARASGTRSTEVYPVQSSASTASPSLSNLFLRNAVQGDTRLLAIHGGGASAGDQIVLAFKNGRDEWRRGVVTAPVAAGDESPGEIALVVPRDPFPLVLEPAVPGGAVAARTFWTQQLVQHHQNEPASNLTYIAEYYYFVPVHLAMALQQNGYFEEALSWYRRVYDYTAPLANRKTWYGLVHEESLANTFLRPAGWLADPLDPHGIASMRRNSYTRFTVQILARCFLEYADAEFTRDTAESLPRARTLYLTALELLDSEHLGQGSAECEAVIGTLDDIPVSEAWQPVWNGIRVALRAVADLNRRRQVAEQIVATMNGDGTEAERLAAARGHLIDPAPQPAPTIGDAVAARGRLAVEHAVLLSNPMVATNVQRAGQAAGFDFLQGVSTVSGIPTSELTNGPVNLAWLRQGLTAASPEWDRFRGGVQIPTTYVPEPVAFCIPANPAIDELRRHANLSLDKLRSCRNIAGLLRAVEPYAAPTDTTSGLPTIGAVVTLEQLGQGAPRPTPYRYAALIERAKQLAQLAAQVEGAMLAALQQRDNEAFQLLQARQGIRVARARVQIQAVRIREARQAVRLAQLQQARAQITASHYGQLLAEGYSEQEIASLALLAGAAAAYTAAAGYSWYSLVWGDGDPGQALRDTASALQTTSSSLSQWAGYERRAQDWQLQQAIAQQDTRIGAQEVIQAETRVILAELERQLGDIEVAQAEDILEFLVNKFTNLELYDWMSGVLEGVYRFFLREATAIAQLAADQLAFERQQAIPAFVESDYWAVRRRAQAADGGGVQDRRGLTGSARLHQAIAQLDQYAFETDRRKLALSKTISLAQFSPIEFQRFRETGLMRFNMSLELFDRDFPGHYLRLIKRVRMTVVALVPPTNGVRATLATTGTSRVVVGPDVFQTMVVRRDPEQVALSSPVNDAGVFELEPQSALLGPFEGLGVDTNWELRMPRSANPFDFRTIADVFMTIEYTALDSEEYRQQVLQQLGRSLSGERPFSFRHQFSDAWYDLHNPGLTATPMTVSFETTRDDFPPNAENLTIQHLALYVSRADGAAFEIPVTYLRFAEQGRSGAVGGGAETVNGVISTRRGNAASLVPLIGRSPFGRWELALPNTVDVKNRFRNEEVDDLLFVISYRARTPAWPQ